MRVYTVFITVCIEMIKVISGASDGCFYATQSTKRKIFWLVQKNGDKTYKMYVPPQGNF